MSYTKELAAASDELVELFHGLEWRQPLHGAVPVQAEGVYKGQYFYFRARFNFVEFVVAPDNSWNYDDDDVRMYFYSITTDPYGAGTLSGPSCVIAIAMFIQGVLDAS